MYPEWGGDKVIHFMPGIFLQYKSINGLPAIWIEQLYTDIAAAAKLPLEDLTQLLVTEEIPDAVYLVCYNQHLSNTVSKNYQNNNNKIHTIYEIMNLKQLHQLL